MVKFVIARPDGSVLVGLGISGDNVARLKLGRPMLIRLAELELPPGADMARSEVVIFFGETEQDLERDLRPFIGPGTRVHRPVDDPAEGG
jgi:hypothetical protein